MSNLAITLALIYIVAVVVVAMVPQAFQLSQATRTRLRWALAIMVAGPFAVGVWMLTRQHDERVRTISAMPSRDVEHLREDKGIEATIEKLRDLEGSIGSAEMGEHTDAELGSGMARRLRSGVED